MIVAKQKPVDEILAMIEPYKRVLVLGCGTCVTVCYAGGEKEVAIVASALRLACSAKGWQKEIVENTILRQCDQEFVTPIQPDIEKVDAIVSLACGVGINFMSERITKILPVFPGVNTTFMGACEELGVWGERCAGCGECILDKTGGLCPVARCAKTIMNGPCGGTKDGKCEIGHGTPCGWYLIVERMKKLGQLHKLEEIMPPKDWRTGRDGGPRKLVLEDVKKS